MGIRSNVKAVVINDNKLLLNFCENKAAKYYTLPGGGQNKYETLYEAVIRECAEETGYTVKPLRLIGLCESIYLGEEARRNDPNHAHKVYHIFLCELVSDKPKTPSEYDSTQLGVRWVALNELDKIRLYPTNFGKQIHNILNGDAPIFLGSEFVDFRSDDEK
jgi:ADP-ribose pyrophosphatase YjhB (NUDIX family)